MKKKIQFMIPNAKHALSIAQVLSICTLKPLKLPVELPIEIEKKGALLLETELQLYAVIPRSS